MNRAEGGRESEPATETERTEQGWREDAEEGGRLVIPSRPKFFEHSRR